MNWWNELTQLQKIFASIAIPTTAIMFIQFILQLFGLANGEGADGVDAADVDTVSDFHGDFPDGLAEVESDGAFDDGAFDDGFEVEEGLGGMRLFTLRSVIAFFAVGGWMGVAAIDWNLSDFMAIVLAIVAGSLALYFVAWIIYTFLRMQQSGNIRYENAVGKGGEVYLSIPPDGRGKVNVIVQDRLCEIDAISKENRIIKTGEKIIVVDITEEGVLIVEPKTLSEKNEINQKM
ncbi:MAG: hypothetical protein GX213_04985 [Clostridiaceae bacterium]|nr:hypothetical protein [Clostridiaceae bacterium]